MSHYEPQHADGHEVFTANGNWGTLVCDVETGEVVEYRRDGDWEKPGDGYDNIVRLDVAEWRAFYDGDDIKAGHDILDFGSWDDAGIYCGPEMDFRFEYLLNWPQNVARLSPKDAAAFRAWQQEQAGNGHASEALDLINR